MAEPKEFDSKDPEEIITLTYDFTAELNGATINPGSASFAIAVVNGADAGVASMPNGAPLIAGGMVFQSVKNGVNACDYGTRCKVNTSDGQTFVIGRKLPVRAVP